jgi:hypothetical protein
MKDWLQLLYKMALESLTAKIIAAMLLMVLICIYAWITLREDSRLSTIPLCDGSLTVFLDLNPRFRQIPAFALIGMVTAFIALGLPRGWVISLFLCACLSPVIKELVQFFHPSRHFDLIATIYGLIGVICGWGIIFGSRVLIKGKFSG